MRTGYIFFLACLSFYTCWSQNSTTIQITKDAGVRDISPNNEYGNYHTLPVLTGTASGTPMLWRSYMEIDLSSLPSNAVIVSATLNLRVTAIHQTSGPNTVELHRTSSSWDELLINWNNKASYVVDAGDPEIPSSGVGAKTVDLTDWVRQSLSNNEQTLSFMFKLVDESKTYIRMNFASAENSNSSYRPSITIEYYDNDIFYSASREQTNDIYTSPSKIFKIKLDEDFVSHSSSLEYEIKDRNNAVLVARNSTGIDLKHNFLKIDRTGTSFGSGLIYHLILYNEKGEERYIKMKM